MRHGRARWAGALLLLAGLALAGCAGSPGEPGVMSSEATEPPLSATELPTIPPPSSPPKMPSDRQGARWREGTVTVGGSGPCYAFVTDDGAELALYSEAGLVLKEGQKARIRVSPASFSATCSPGTLMRLLAVEGE